MIENFYKIRIKYFENIVRIYLLAYILSVRNNLKTSKMFKTVKKILIIWSKTVFIVTKSFHQTVIVDLHTAMIVS